MTLLHCPRCEVMWQPERVTADHVWPLFQGADGPGDLVDEDVAMVCCECPCCGSIDVEAISAVDLL